MTRTFQLKEDLYTVKDVSNDPTWHDVKAVEDRRNPGWGLLSVVNHRQRNFEQVCDELIKQGATEIKIKITKVILDGKDVTDKH